MVEDIGTGGFDHVATATRDAADIVNNIVNCDKPIVSAINGVAVGAGLAVALMADISIVAEEAKLTDGHLRIGVGAGDHAAIIWPLLCGMAKAKYLLMTAAVIDGREAERIGLVSDCVPRAELMEKAFAVADALGSGPQHALKWTKRSLNHWLRQATPIFEASLAYEMLTFMSDDAREGIRAVRENRPPRFPSAQG
jgi:enoyl-CoA hydratase